MRVSRTNHRAKLSAIKAVPGFFGFSIENSSKNYSTCKERSLIKWNFHLHPEELLRASITDILSNETTYCERGNKVDSFYN